MTHASLAVNGLKVLTNYISQCFCCCFFLICNGAAGIRYTLSLVIKVQPGIIYP